VRSSIEWSHFRILSAGTEVNTTLQGTDSSILGYYCPVALSERSLFRISLKALLSAFGFHVDFTSRLKS